MKISDAVQHSGSRQGTLNIRGHWAHGKQCAKRVSYFHYFNHFFLHFFFYYSFLLRFDVLYMRTRNLHGSLFLCILTFVSFFTANWTSVCFLFVMLVWLWLYWRLGNGDNGEAELQ